MRTSIITPTLFLFASLLLVAGCGAQSEAPSEETPPSEMASVEEALPEEALPEEAPVEGTEVASSPLASPTVGIVNSEGERVEVEVEISDEPAEQQRGLMERTELAESAGMLFVFDREEPRSFWMRNTLIPLSIAYIDGEGSIVDIQDMEALDDVPPHYASAEPAQYALEVNQGFFEERGVEEGDRAELPPNAR